MDKQQPESITTTAAAAGQSITGAGTAARDTIKPAAVDFKGKGKAATIEGNSKDETMDDDDDDDNIPNYDDDDDEEEEEEEEKSDEDGHDDDDELVDLFSFWLYLFPVLV